jgi:DNA repair exonuclease SbcCD ATPase subunit
MIASASQDDVDALGDPSGLDRLESAISLELEELRIMANDAQAIEDDEHRAAILSFIDAEKRYLTELVRLAGLSSEEASIDQYDLIGDLADEAEEEMAAAITLRPGDPPVTGVVLSPAPLTRALSELAAYRAEVVKERARITRLNKERAKKLATVRSATEQVDGIIDRYSTARAELSNWISGVNSHGATFLEAYQVLDQQAERRRQLRDELAALEMPDPFGQDKAALLAVMDQAVAATEAAYRGIEEYQYDFNYRYYSYDQTPGWLQFEAATDDISDSYSATLANYEDRKLTVLKKISRRTPLPKLPD